MEKERLTRKERVKNQRVRGQVIVHTCTVVILRLCVCSLCLCSRCGADYFLCVVFGGMQSGIGDDFRTWKTDEEMRLRQQFD